MLLEIESGLNAAGAKLHLVPTLCVENAGVDAPRRITEVGRTIEHKSKVNGRRASATSVPTERPWERAKQLA